MLKPWINKEGLVDYETMKNDPWIQEKLHEIEIINISQFDYNEKFAFWLNAYNLLTIKNVLTEFEKNPQWKGNLSILSKIRFFYLRKFKVAGEKINLYNLENKILRKRFKDPRIHFAINCASRSCPILPGKLFQAEFLNEYLEELTSTFINDESNVFLDEQNKILFLNRIFKYYKKDFKEGIRNFILKYLTRSIPLDNFKLEYFEYDWSVNTV